MTSCILTWQMVHLFVFVGCFAGSLLVACAHFGGHVLGTDIDYNLLVGVGRFITSRVAYLEF